jgi:hypothetical protein
VSDHEWERLIPPNELPSIRNPECGYAVTCNQKITTDDYPYILSQHYSSNDHRVQRITQRIEAVPAGKMTVAEMSSIHKERVSISAVQVVDVVRTIDAAGLSSAAATLHTLLIGWDGDMQPELAAPTAFAAVMEALTNACVPRIYGAELGAAILGGGRGGPTHWAIIKAALLKEAAEQPGGGGHMASYLLSAGGAGSWAQLYAEALEVGGRASEFQTPEPCSGGLESLDTSRYRPSDGSSPGPNAGSDWGAQVGGLALVDRLGVHEANAAKWAWGAVHTTSPSHPLSRLCSGPPGGS